MSEPAMGRWAGRKSQRVLRWLSLATTLGMFVVLWMGAAVTNTGSAEGCGRSWPLCHGEFIPQFALSTAIEYSHRAVTGIEGLLIVATSVGAWTSWKHRLEIRLLVPLMIVFLVVQAALGALAVMYPQTPAVLASHFGISLTAFASTLLTTAFLYEVRGTEAVRNRPLPPGFRSFVWAVLGYVYVIVYLGAYVRHTNAVLACIDWPLCNGALVPPLEGPVGIHFAHRAAAGFGLVLVLALVLWARSFRQSRRGIYYGSLVALGLMVAQALMGAVVVWSMLDVFAALGHAALATLLFGALSYVAMHTFALPQAKQASDANTGVTVGQKARPAAQES